MRTSSASSICGYKTPLNSVDLTTGELKGFQAYDDVVHLKNARLVLGGES